MTWFRAMTPSDAPLADAPKPGKASRFPADAASRPARTASLAADAGKLAPAPPSRPRAAPPRPVVPTPAPPPALHDAIEAVLELLNGPLTPPPRLTHRQRNKVEHNLDQARLLLRRALALMA